MLRTIRYEKFTRDFSISPYIYSAVNTALRPRISKLLVYLRSREFS